MPTQRTLLNAPFNGQVDLWADKSEIQTDWAPWFVGKSTGPTVGHVRTYSTAGNGSDVASESGGSSNSSDISDISNSSNSSAAPHVFHFVVLSGAGHEVPAYRPEAALTMLNRYDLSRAA
jgi:hypothetical protein